MKRLLIVLAVVIFISGCASSKPINMPLVISEAKNIAQDKKLYIVDIPSHGALGDAASIAAEGGGAARQLRQSIEKVHQLGGGSIVVTSTNPALPRAHIKGAMEGLEIMIENMILIYAGDIKYSDSIKLEVEAKGIKYGFVDAYRQM